MTQAMSTRAASTRAVSTTGVRLTRRGRIVVVLLMLTMLIVGGFTLGRASSQAAGPDAHRPVPTVTVAPGETLWEIAARMAPHADRRALVAQIEAINHLSGGHVMAGQQLRLPVTG
jgi:hypothetical protein